MEIVKHLYLDNNEKEAFQKKPCVIAMGTFDGLHKGHRDVIDAAAAYARANRLLPLSCGGRIIATLFPGVFAP